MPSLQDMYNEPKPMTAHEKAAILFIALGGDYAAKVFEHMDEDEIESITLEIANNKHVSVEKKAMVISEFYQLMMATITFRRAVWNMLKRSWKKHWGRKKLPRFSTASRQVCKFVRSSSCARQTRHNF